jgi:hypothetical protein
MRCSERWGVLGVVVAMAACGQAAPEEPPPVDVSRIDAGAPVASGACVDPQLGQAGPSTINGDTPVGAFSAAGARAFGRCLWLQFVSVKMVEGRPCQQELVTAATGLRVPPWFDGSRLAVGISLVGADGQPLVAAGTLTIDSVVEGSGVPVLKGSLTSRQPGWTLDGTFEAPWTDQPCK